MCGDWRPPQVYIKTVQSPLREENLFGQQAMLKVFWVKQDKVDYVTCVEPGEERAYLVVC